MIRFRPFQSWIGVRSRHLRRRRHGRWGRRRSRGWCETAFGFPCLGIGIFWSRWKEIPWKMDSRETNRKAEFQFQAMKKKKKKWEWVKLLGSVFWMSLSSFCDSICRFVNLWKLKALVSSLPQVILWEQCSLSVFPFQFYIYTFGARANLPCLRRRLIFI